MTRYYRKLIKAPKNLVADGKANLGSFNSYFEALNFSDIQKLWGKPVPRFIKHLRLKEWQAFQFWHKDILVFGAIYNAKTIGVSVFSVYKFKSKEKHHSIKTTPAWKQRIAKNLFRTSSVYRSKNQELEIRNDMELKRFEIRGKNSDFDIKLNVTAYHTTEPMVSVIPFGKNRFMYSHKALMPCSGNMVLAVKKVEVGRNDGLLILDDHKGFYPYKLKYNWCTAAWRTSDGEFFAFNLTENQSEDPEKYNENCFWVNGIVQTLPPVSFTFTDDQWQIRDKYGMVAVTFNLKTNNALNINLGLLASDYQAPYGTFSGKIQNPKYSLRLNEVPGMGEKKRYKL